DEFDYLYNCHHLATLAGPVLRKRRNQLKHFLTETNNLQVIDINLSNLSRVIDFAIKQDEAHPDKDFLHREIMAMNAMQSNWQECSLQGFFAVDDRDAIIGFSIFSPTCYNVMDVHFEKASRDFHGAAQFVCCETARRAAAQNFEFLNREQDMGEPGLRHSKRALDPAGMFKRFNLTPKF
ncbi:MAG: phosphatidylglycerol lysyltransferase domain-containing protein, partial [Victivallaceae bacterium]